MSDDMRDFESRFYSLDIGVQIVGDWFVMAGAEFDEDAVGTAKFIEYDLKGITFVVGPPTVAVGQPTRAEDGALADVTAMLGLGLPYDTDTLRSMIDPVLAVSPEWSDLIEIEYPESDDEALWAVVRPCGSLVETDTLDEHLRGFVSIAESLVGAVN